MKYLKKLTVAGCEIDTRSAEALAVEQNKEVAILRIYGSISAKTPKTSNYGPYMLFDGMVEGQNLITGEKYRAKQMILPAIAEVSLNGDVEKEKSEDVNKEVVFGLDITVRPTRSDKGGWKFAYGVKNLMEAKGDDTLSKLGKSLGTVPLITDKTPKTKK